jgi:hypothetical protein
MLFVQVYYAVLCKVFPYFATLTSTLTGCCQGYGLFYYPACGQCPTTMVLNIQGPADLHVLLRLVEEHCLLLEVERRAM